MKRKRSSDAIICQILEVCVDGASKTKIVYKSNLNFTTINPYLDLLISSGLIEPVRGPRVVYKTTEKGAKIMKSFKQLHGEIAKIITSFEDTDA